MVKRPPSPPTLKTPSTTSTSPSTQIQAEKVQSTELALPVTERGPIHQLKEHPFPVEGGQGGETEAQLGKGAKTSGWEYLPRFQVLRLGYQPSTWLPRLNWGLGHRGRNLWEDSSPCLSFPAGSPPLPVHCRQAADGRWRQQRGTREERSRISQAR